MVDPEHKTPSEKNIRVEVTDKKVLGALDPDQIPPGYGILLLNPKFRTQESHFDKPEYLITNNTGDVRLFIDPDLRSLSSMELKEGKFAGFFSGLQDLPPEYQDAMNKVQMPQIIQTTKSKDGTEFVHAVGKGTPEDPLKIIPLSTQTPYKDIFLLVHPAASRHVFLLDQPLTVSLNEVIYTYTPKKGVAVEVEAAVTFKPPREDIAAIKVDIETNTPLPIIEIDYYNFLIARPGVSKDPVTWYRENYSLYGIKLAEAVFKRTQDMLRKKRSESLRGRRD